MILYVLIKVHVPLYNLDSPTPSLENHLPDLVTHQVGGQNHLQVAKAIGDLHLPPEHARTNNLGFIGVN